MDTSHNHLREPNPCESSFLRAKGYLSDLSKVEKEVLLSNLAKDSGKILVENFPDEEDLTQKMQGSLNVLKFKDKIFNPEQFSGLGKVFLRKNIVRDVNNCGKPINILTLDMFEDEHGLPLINTIFIIQYDYDLDKGFITIPENSVLVFAGGSFFNGTVMLRNTLILPAGLDIEHFMSVNIRGNYKEGSLVYLRKHLRLFNGQNWVNIGGSADFSPQDKLEIINVLKKYVNTALDIVSPFKIIITPEKNYIETGEHDIKVSWDYNRLINNQDIRLESGSKYAIYEELDKNVREYVFEGIDAEDPVTIVISTTYKGETISEAITLTFEQNPGLVIDDELNENSINPVTNRAIARIINQIESNIGSVDEKFENYLGIQEFDEYKSEINNDLSEFNQTLSNKVDLSEFNQALNGKVDKVSGKGLSTNDFTDADKTKLNGIEDGAQRNPDLSGYATTAAVSEKQDKLPDGRNDGDVLKWDGDSWKPGIDEKGTTEDIAREIRKLSLTKQSNNIQITYDGQSVGSSVIDEVGETIIVPNRFSEDEYEIATINGTKIYGKDSSGEGSNVSWTQHTQTGNHIADITINGTTTNIYAPAGGETGASQFKEMIFNRSETKPSTPIGGTYTNPITSAMAALGWSDNPSGTGTLWFSTKMFSSDGTSLGDWSEPEVLADSETIDVCYHPSERKPNPPTTHGSQGTNPNTWHDEGNENDKWLATSVKNNGVWGDWSIVEIKGAKGDIGNTYNLIFNNASPVYYDLNTNKLTEGTLSWNFYINGENKTNDYYYLVTSGSDTIDTDGNNYVEFTTSNNYKSVNIIVYRSNDYSLESIYSKQYVFPTKGLKGDTGTGEQGLQGCVLRNCGLYNPNTTYVNEAYYVPQDPSTIRYIDYVVYPLPTDLVNTYYYMVAPLTTETGRRTVTGVTPSDQSQVWIKATQMDFAYIKNLIADYIDSKVIVTDELLIKRENQDVTTIVAGMTKGDMSQPQSGNAILWAGSNGSTQINIKDSPFVVYEDGHMEASNAKITGDIAATSFNVINNGNIVLEMTTWGAVSGSIDVVQKQNIDSNTLNSLKDASPVIVITDYSTTPPAKYILNLLAFETNNTVESKTVLEWANLTGSSAYGFKETNIYYNNDTNLWYTNEECTNTIAPNKYIQKVERLNSVIKLTEPNTFDMQAVDFYRIINNDDTHDFILLSNDALTGDRIYWKISNSTYSASVTVGVLTEYTASGTGYVIYAPGTPAIPTSSDGINTMKLSNTTMPLELRSSTNYSTTHFALLPFILTYGSKTWTITHVNIN